MSQQLPEYFLEASGRDTLSHREARKTIETSLQDSIFGSLDANSRARCIISYCVGQLDQELANRRIFHLLIAYAALLIERDNEQEWQKDLHLIFGKGWDMGLLSAVWTVLGKKQHLEKVIVFKIQITCFFVSHYSLDQCPAKILDYYNKWK